MKKKSLNEHGLRTIVEGMGPAEVLTLTNESGDVIGSVSAEELRSLLKAQQPDTAARLYLDLLQGMVKEREIFQRAGNLGIPMDATRIVYLIELGAPSHAGSADDGDASDDDTRPALVCELLRQMYSDERLDVAVPLSSHAVALIHGVSGKKDAGQLSTQAERILSTIHTELLERARIAYGNSVRELQLLAQSYREARVAMEVAEVFYGEREVVSYTELGIGRLIYELPVALCEQFLAEIFGGQGGVRFAEQELATVNKFFENNLNLSETARELYIHRNTLVYHLEKLQKKTGLDIRNFDDALTLKIALMVKRYLEWQGGRLRPAAPL